MHALPLPSHLPAPNGKKKKKNVKAAERKHGCGLHELLMKYGASWGSQLREGAGGEGEMQLVRDLLSLPLVLSPHPSRAAGAVLRLSHLAT